MPSIACQKVAERDVTTGWLQSFGLHDMQSVVTDALSVVLQATDILKTSPRLLAEA